MSQPKMTRESLIHLCELAIVPQDKWRDSDTPAAQKQIGEAWAYLKAGCEFKVRNKENSRDYLEAACITDNRTIWIEIIYHDYTSMREHKKPTEISTFYLPRPSRIKKRKDWY